MPGGAEVGTGSGVEIELCEFDLGFTSTGSMSDVNAEDWVPKGDESGREAPPNLGF